MYFNPITSKIEITYFNRDGSVFAEILGCNCRIIFQMKFHKDATDTRYVTHVIVLSLTMNSEKKMEVT